jgi:hypothetical protein
MLKSRSNFGPAVLAAGLLVATVSASVGCSTKAPFTPEAPEAVRGGAASIEGTSQAAPDVDNVEPPAITDSAEEVTLLGQPGALQTAAAGRYTSPLPGNCIRQFYDTSFYGWLAFQNVCSQAIYVDYIAFNPGYGGSSVTLRPNQKSSTGWSRKEVQVKRGFQLFLCPSGYLPVDGNNRFVNKVNTPYRCLQR